MSAKWTELRTSYFLPSYWFNPFSLKEIDSSLMPGMLSAMPFGFPAVTTTRLIEPSLWYSLLGLPFFLLGGVGYHFALTLGTNRALDSFTQLVIPGQVELPLQMGQKLTVFFENGSVESGVPYSSPVSLEGLHCDVRETLTGTSFQTHAADPRLTYTFHGRSGHAVLEFLAPGNGSYLISCTSPAAAHGNKAVLQLGVGALGKFSRVVFESQLVFAAGVALALIPFLIVIFKRDRSKRRIRAEGLKPV
jgi:hypothetical protein